VTTTSPSAMTSTPADADRTPSYRLVRPSRQISWRETKPSPKTTELWLTIVGVVVLAIVYNASRDASLNLFRACSLATVLAAAYVLSRGLAKAGSHDDDDVVDVRSGRDDH
jgi:hypothetical protein